MRTMSSFLPGLLLCLLPVMWFSCDHADSHPTGNTEETEEELQIDEPYIFDLVERSMDNGHYTILVPEEYNDYETGEVLGKDSAVAINTYKYRSLVDSISAIGISHGVSDDATPRHLQKFMLQLEEEARHFKGLRTISTETRIVNDLEFGILRYSLWNKGKEVDYSVVAASVVEENMLTLNILFSGPVKNGYKEASNKIIGSFRVHEQQ